MEMGQDFLQVAIREGPARFPVAQTRRILPADSGRTGLVLLYAPVGNRHAPKDGSELLTKCISSFWFISLSQHNGGTKIMNECSHLLFIGYFISSYSIGFR
jgi:hypothetical protein